MTSTTTTQTINGIELTIDIEHAYHSGDNQWSMDATDENGNDYTVYVEGEYAEQMTGEDFDWETARIEAR